MRKFLKDGILEKIKVTGGVKIRKKLKINTSFYKDRKNKEAQLKKIIIIGSSTGGPSLIEDIISKLPENLNIAIIIAQHMPEYFTKRFSESLNKNSVIPVKEAEGGDKIKPGVILVAPGSHYAIVEKSNIGSENIIKLSKEEDENKLTPSIDSLMLSASKCYGSDVVGIILTGMGKDGTEGMKAIKKMGGYTIVQSPDTTVISSMVRSVIEANVVDAILNPDDIVKKIIKISS